jgi:carbonic anhydrase
MTSSIGVDESVRQDVALVKQAPFLKKDLYVVGYVLDVDSGLLREVV